MLWIAGTSVSIQDGGYVTRLARLAAAKAGIATTNLSVGDQTSVMGCMRVLDSQAAIAGGDVVIWEYSLLDALLSQPFDDTKAARRVAWDCVFRRRANLVIVMTPPQTHVANRTVIETEIADEASLLGVDCFDLREMFAARGIADPAAHYRDDRHPRLDSPIVDDLTVALLDLTTRLHGRVRAPPTRALGRWRKNLPRHWYWIDAATLVTSADNLHTFRNSLMSVTACELPVNARLSVPPPARVIAVGVVSTHVSGGLWCGHAGCAPAATGMPPSLPYAFLLRATPLPCVQACITELVSAPALAYGRGVWAAYGQQLSGAPGTVVVFGVLCGDKSHLKRLWSRWIRFARQGLSRVRRQLANRLRQIGIIGRDERCAALTVSAKSDAPWRMRACRSATNARCLRPARAHDLR